METFVKGGLHLNHVIESALKELYARQFVSREQLLTEMLRVKLTGQSLQNELSVETSKENLFQSMKSATEATLGFFSADRNDFYEIYMSLKDIDLESYVLEIYKNDRMGMIVSPKYLTTYVTNQVKQLKPKRILITEAEKHLNGLKEFVEAFKKSQITLTTQYNTMNILLKLIFKDQIHVKVVFESIYSPCLIDQKYDYIFTFPNLGYKFEELGNAYFTRESDGIAIENLLNHLSKEGKFDVIVPAKVTFATQGYELLRKFIESNYQVEQIYMLPEGTFRPTTAVKTYWLRFSDVKRDQIQVGSIELVNDKFEVDEVKDISTAQFNSHEDWRIELLLSEDDEHIQRFKQSTLEKIKLKEVAEVFRGKSILKKDTIVGEIGVLNISNIENGEIDYTQLDFIDEEMRKIKRYELEEADVVLSCRGTAIKTALFKKQEQTIIASANLIVIRPSERVLGGYIKIFFESPVGLSMIKSFQRGTSVMNINHSDIMEMEIPLISLEQQEGMVTHYEDEQNKYLLAIKEAENRWQNIKYSLYEQLT